jgi:pimeloyl-ACP methyl ester carboxylesterase
VKWWKGFLAGAVLWRLFGPKIHPEFTPPQEAPLRVPGRTVYVGDDEFLVREMGSDNGVPILLVHGLAGTSLTEWYQVAPKLAVDRRVIMVDHRGHGLSAAGDTRFEVSDDADDLSGTLDALGIGQVDVVGYSMGGIIAQAFVQRHPGRVRKLVLIATFASHSESYKWARRIGAVIARAWERLTGVGTPEIRSGYLIARHAVRPEHARWIWRETQRRDLESGAQATFAMLRFDSRDWIGKLDVEAMVMVPTSDFLVPPRWQYELASAIPDVRLVEIPNAGHEVVWTHSDLIGDELREFLD